MDRQEAIDVATVHTQVTVRLLLKGTGFGAAAALPVSVTATRTHKEIDY